jgi:hypothetical protein
MQVSPVPTYTTFGSLSATAMAPTEPAPNALSESGVHEMPASTVFQTPPPVAPW